MPVSRVHKKINVFTSKCELSNFDRAEKQGALSSCLKRPPTTNPVELTAVKSFLSRISKSLGSAKGAQKTKMTPGCAGEYGLT